MLEDTYFHFAAKLLAMEPFAVVIAAMLCGAGALMLNQFVNSPTLNVASFPGLMLGAIAANHALRISEITISVDPQISSIVASTAGMVLVLVIFTLVAHLAGAIEPKVGANRQAE